MDGDAAELVADHLALASVHSCSDAEAQLPDGITDGAGAADGPRGTVERREEPIACRVDFTTPEALELLADDQVMLCDEVSPAAVAQVCCPLCGADDVGEQHGDEHAIWFGRVAHAREPPRDCFDQRMDVPRLGEMIDALQLDVLRGR